MKFARLTMLLALLLLVMIPLAAQDDPVATEEPMPDSDMAMIEGTIVFEAAGIMPEGVEWDAERERFLVGSLMTGTIYAVFDDGSFEPFIENEAFGSTVGIHIDEANDRLIVANGDARVFNGPPPEDLVLGVAAFDLESGDELFFVDLNGLSGIPAGFANDVTVDDAGNVYVTDSIAPAIYVVTPEGEASVFLQDDAFLSNFIGLNGIDFVSGEDDEDTGYLLAAYLGSGTIFKIPLDAPEEFAAVEIEQSVVIDGLVVVGGEYMVAVATVSDVEGQQLALIASEDDWTTAEVVETVAIDAAATTVAVRDDVAYYVNAYLNNPAQATYEIVPVEFEAMMMEMDGDE